MKVVAAITILVLSLTLIPACGAQNGDVSVGSTNTETIDVGTPPGSGPYRLELAMGAGTLNLSPGAGEKIVQGTVTYNVDEFKPVVTTSGSTVRIEQGRPSLRSFTGHVKNDWNLTLGNAPMALKLSTGAAKGELELGGLSLTDLTVTQGATDFTVSFSQLNGTTLDTLSYQAGAAKTVMNDLSNANARKMEFKGGAGDLRLDFAGSLQRDLQVSVTAAAGNVVITVPAGVPAVATVNGVLATVTTSGAWSKSGNRYALNGSGPAITFDVKMSVGKLDLRSS